MRITGGIARGIPLRVPSAGGVRPATDYIREAVFNSLAAFVPGTVVLDLFAGTGAYGLESLSRGALSATCVDRRIGAELPANAAAVAKSMGQAELPFTKITGDATKPGVAEGRFDLVFADPPWELWPTQGAEIAATAVSYADAGGLETQEGDRQGQGPACRVDPRARRRRVISRPAGDAPARRRVRPA